MSWGGTHFYRSPLSLSYIPSLDLFPPYPIPSFNLTQPVGAGSAVSAVQAMANLLGNPSLVGGAAQDSINGVLGNLSPMQLFEVMTQVKILAQQNLTAIRQALVSQPQLTRALFQAQILLGMVKPLQQGGEGGGGEGGGVGAPPPPPVAAIPPVQSIPAAGGGPPMMMMQQ